MLDNGDESDKAAEVGSLFRKGADPMSEANIGICRRWFEEAWNQRRDDVVHELLVPESVSHTEAGDVRGRDEFLRYRADFLAAFPDLRVTVEDVVAQGDQVVVRWHTVARHTGAGLGMEPTGQPIDVRGTTWMRLAKGKLIEGWDNWNLAGLMQQLRVS
jgi:steroid delta-isomerase-like uncharacterized protein